MFPIVALATLGAVLAAPAAARVSTYSGQYLCDDRGTVTPLAGMNVELWERGSPDFLPVEIVGHRVDQDFTDSEGRFAMTTEDNNDNYFVRMALRDAHGVHLRDFWGINDWSVDSEQKRNDVDREYGGMVFSSPGQSHKCAIWAGVHGANERFRSEVGVERGVEIEADAVTAGTPFTPGTSILWPGGFPVGYSGGGDDSITRHEFGHVIRHGYDGDFGHFLGDVVAYNYAQNHEPCLHSNGGYAFNEGWAEFWAEDFAPAPDCGRPGDMETEGNVAAALQELMDNCAGGKRKLMVETLIRNPGTIHSFDQFKAALGCPEPRLFPVSVIRAEIAPPKPITITAAQRAAIAKGEASATSKKIASLTKALDVSIKKAENPPECKPKTCKAALKAVARPPILKMERAIARIHLGAVDDSDTAKEQETLAGTDLKKLIESQQARKLRDTKKTIKAALKGVQGAIGAVRPYLKGPGGAETKGILIGLNKAAAKFRRALKKGGALPDLLVSSPFSAKPPRRVPPISSFPQPTPPPKASTLTVSSLTLSCPVSVASPKPIEVSGTLAPGQAGSPVQVTFSFSGGGSATVSASTDAAGAWKASFTPGPNDTGAWKVSAAFAGDSARTASSAAPCALDYL